jgi:hypothetical protein
MKPEINFENHQLSIDLYQTEIVTALSIFALQRDA